MTEAEWLTSPSPFDLLEAAWRTAGERKTRLFACACARTVWHLVGDNQHAAIEAAERHAEGLADWDSLATHRAANMGVAAGTARTAAEEAIRAATEIMRPPYQPTISYAEIERVRMVAAGLLVDDGPDPAELELMIPPPTREPPADFLPRLCGLARCVFAPFHAPAPAPTWRTPEVRRIALAAYEGRALPSGHLDALHLNVLADALTDAGCDDVAMLDHLRSSGSHVRGCWALDLALGRA